jgi:hypothetical protein
MGLQPLVEKRLARYLRKWPPAVAEEVVAYLGRPATDAVDRHHGEERFWSLLPRWLASDRRFVATPRRHTWLNDILWAQYCLFLFVRIHDDLFDRQTDSPALVFVADQLLLVCETTLARHQPAVAFWPLFRASVSTTLAAILEVDALQRQPRAMKASSLVLHARVSDIFKIGAAAICVDARRMRDFRHISRCADELAIAEQILDDLFDIEEDVVRGRYTFVANTLLGDGTVTDEWRASVAQQILFGDGVGAILDRAATHVDRARTAIDRLRLVPASRYLENFRRRLDELRPVIHRARVEHVFRDLTDMSGRRILPSSSQRTPSARNRHVAPHRRRGEGDVLRRDEPPPLVGRQRRRPFA